jgi:hypothetical protein
VTTIVVAFFKCFVAKKVTTTTVAFFKCFVANKAMVY